MSKQPSSCCSALGSPCRATASPYGGPSQQSSNCRSQSPGFNCICPRVPTSFGLSQTWPLTLARGESISVRYLHASSDSPKSPILENINTTAAPNLVASGNWPRWPSQHAWRNLLFLYHDWFDELILNLCVVLIGFGQSSCGSMQWLLVLQSWGNVPELPCMQWDRRAFSSIHIWYIYIYIYTHTYTHIYIHTSLHFSIL